MAAVLSGTAVADTEKYKMTTQNLMMHVTGLKGYNSILTCGYVLGFSNLMPTYEEPDKCHVKTTMSLLLRSTKDRPELPKRKFSA